MYVQNLKNRFLQLKMSPSVQNSVADVSDVSDSDEDIMKAIRESMKDLKVQERPNTSQRASASRNERPGLSNVANMVHREPKSLGDSTVKSNNMSEDEELQLALKESQIGKFNLIHSERG